MSNPYLPIPFNENDFGLAIFQPDMVLTHEQLNSIFGYLMHQNTRTRTHLSGVGVVCGLESKKVGNTIEISRGCGITTEGDLISFQENRTYTQFMPYVLTNHTPYIPFQNIKGLQLWELFPAEFADTQPKKNLAELDLSDKVVMLYLESQRKAADRCTGVDCDNQGDKFLNRLHVLLVGRTDANSLIEKAHQHAAMACSQLPRLRSQRFDNDFQATLKDMSNDFLATIKKANEVLVEVFNPSNKNFVFTSSINNTLLSDFESKIKSLNIEKNTTYFLYHYDWLKDLCDAYEEFREATCCWLSVCVPNETWFPKHLLLGELTSTTCKLEFRHYFLRSPAVLDCKDGKDKAIWLFQRIIRLIQNFKIPQPKVSGVSGKEFNTDVLSPRKLRSGAIIGYATIPIPIEITPSLTRNALLGERAMPFYYTPETRNFWSYEKTKKCQQADILSYHLPANPPDYVEFPFSYDVDKLSFYRIEGIIGKEYGAVLKELIDLRKTYNLAFSIIGLSTSAKVVFEKAESESKGIAAPVSVDAAKLSASDSTVKSVSGMAAKIDTPIGAKADSGKILTEKEPQLEFAGDRAIINPEKDFQTPTSSVTAGVTATSVSSAFERFKVLHSGIEHLAGVHRGGTFILVHNPIKGQGDTVIADFQLPYFIPDDV